QSRLRIERRASKTLSSSVEDMRRPRYLLLLSCCAALLVLLLPSAAAASLPRAQIVWAETQETAGYFQDLVEESWMPSPPVKVDLRYRHCPRWPKWRSCM